MEKKTVLRKICGVVAALMVLAMTLTVLPAASKADAVTVTFNPNGGELNDYATLEFSETETTFGASSAYPPNNPNRDGYTFDGWYSAAEGGDPITGETTVADHTTVYAHWTSKVKGISLSDTSWDAQLKEPKETKELTATVEMKDPSADQPAIKWSTSDSSVAKVAVDSEDDSKATVTAVGVGPATITAVCAGQSVACAVTVTAPAPSPSATPASLLSFELDPAKKTLYDSQTVQLNPTNIKPADAEIDSIEYASDKPAVASVDSNGKVTAKGYGEATITAIATDKAGNKVSATSKITVKPMIYLTFDPNSSKIGYQDVVEMTIKITNPSESYAWVKRSNQRIYYTGYTEKVKAKDGTVWYKCKLTDGKATLKIKPQYNGKVKVTVSHHDATSVSADFTVSGYHNLPTTGQNDTLIYILIGAGTVVAAGLVAAYTVKRKKEHVG